MYLKYIYIYFKVNNFKIIFFFYIYSTLYMFWRWTGSPFSNNYRWRWTSSPFSNNCSWFFGSTSKMRLNGFFWICIESDIFLVYILSKLINMSCYDFLEWNMVFVFYVWKWRDGFDSDLILCRNRKFSSGFLVLIIFWWSSGWNDLSWFALWKTALFVGA